MNAQLNQANTVNYGATQHAVNPFSGVATAPTLSQGNPFAAPTVSQGNPFANPSMSTEPVQPYPTDPYMHGTAEQRDFNQY